MSLKSKSIKFKIEGTEYRAEITNKGSYRVTFTPMVPVEGGAVSYVETNFYIHYAPAVAKSAYGVYKRTSSRVLKDLMREVVERAVDCVSQWELRDTVDSKDAEKVIAIYKEMT